MTHGQNIVSFVLWVLSSDNWLAHLFHDGSTKTVYFNNDNAGTQALFLKYTSEEYKVMAFKEQLGNHLIKLATDWFIFLSEKIKEVFST